MDKVDLLLPNYLYDALDNVFILASVFIVAAMAVPFTLLMFIPVILSFHFITRLYRVSSREVMRMDAISRCKSFMMYPCYYLLKPCVFS